MANKYSKVNVLSRSLIFIANRLPENLFNKLPNKFKKLALDVKLNQLKQYNNRKKS